MSFTIWFTGLSGAGKSTLARHIYQKLKRNGFKAELLDGDLVRDVFAHDLGFSKRDRDIHVRRLGFLSHLLNKHEVVSVVAAIAPYAETRERNRQLIGRYVEVYCNCPLEVAEKRDVKGLYALARLGQIQNFTGISDPYEEPRSSEVVVYTDRETVAESMAKIVRYLESHDYLLPEEDPQL
jgi:adenylylsulfate kinase